ncbi:hypothetical protein SAMN04488540_107156 [Ferrimonas sediminum]|uniref:Uncharacterized protein n=1 Tax=Ferrimonas sediminum TaxID=718193 RepID=A0A1G8TCJ3_9GAMM|nr:hypothetical protein [Ferrimonas sediminum]SDJ38400.1 hypothetical protein SAMN04488540_107156 [Ferrimonas sediminum]
MKRSLWVVFILVGLSGCASPYRQGLEPDRSGDLVKAKVYANLSDTELDAQYPVQQTTAVGGGALGGLAVALVDAYVNSSNESEAEDAIAKLKQAMGPEALKLAYQKQYQLLMEAMPELRGRPVTVLEKAPKGGAKGLGLAPEEIGLVLTPGYSLTVSKRRLQVSLVAELYQKPGGNKAKTRKPKLMYRNRFVYQSDALEAVDSMPSPEEVERRIAEIRAKYAELPKDSLARNKAQNKRNRALKKASDRLPQAMIDAKQSAKWLDDDANALRQHMHTGVQEVFAMMAFDVKLQLDKSELKKTKIVRAGEQRQWVRLVTPGSGGVLVSLEKSDALEVPNTTNGTVYLGPY